VTDSSTRFLRFIGLIGILGGISACASSGLPDTRSPEDSEEVPAAMNMSRQIEFAKADLAQRLDVDPGQVLLSGAQSVTWRSGALGCPEPGMNYTQALVPGTVIYLKVDTMIHAYHARVAGEPFYCPRERVEPPAADGDDLT
jgi:hypothetical protein